jgi:carbonic anhydrase/acetyltransferase-like protein (isoleucine patch superfamily)
VLHEVVIESGSTVAAGAVVRNRTHVPANSLVVGVPGKIRPDASSEEEIVANAALYVANAARYRRDLRVL